MNVDEAKAMMRDALRVDTGAVAEGRKAVDARISDAASRGETGVTLDSLWNFRSPASPRVIQAIRESLMDDGFNVEYLGDPYGSDSYYRISWE